MKVSVIIPSYKPQEYFWKCLISLVKQSFDVSDFEIIVVLNGCCEPWQTEIKKFISRNMQNINVNLIHTPDPGVSNARNLALDIAKGEYITFIDDDDYVSPSYLEELYAKAAPDTIALSYPYAFCDNAPETQLSYSITTQYEKYRKSGQIPFLKARKFFSGPCMKMIHRDCISHRRFDIRFSNGEDSLFMFLISDKIRYANLTSQEAIYYRRYRTGSASANRGHRYAAIKNSLMLLVSYSKIYFSSPVGYSFIFYVTRLLASIKSIFKAKMN